MSLKKPEIDDIQLKEDDDYMANQTTTKGSGMSQTIQINSFQGNQKVSPTQKKSLLFQSVRPMERERNSVSCLEKLETITEEGQFEFATQLKVFTIYWYNTESDIKHEISFRTSTEITVYNFINQTIMMFNQQFESECLGIYLEPLTDPKSFNAELYMVKKKNGKPNMDFPSFDYSVKLGQTNLLEFALVVNQQERGLNNKIELSQKVQPKSDMEFKRQSKVNESQLEQTLGKLDNNSNTKYTINEGPVPKKKFSFFMQFFCCVSEEY